MRPASHRCYIGQAIAFCLGLVQLGMAIHQNSGGLFLISGLFIGLSTTDCVLQLRYEKARRKANK